MIFCKNNFNNEDIGIFFNIERIEKNYYLNKNMSPTPYK